MNKTHLEVKNLNVTLYSKRSHVEAVRNVSFTLQRGERLGIIGESGSGKSQMAKAILRLISKENGTITANGIFYEGIDLLKLSEKEIRSCRGREIAMIFQDSRASLNPTMKVGQQIAEAYLEHHPLSRKIDAKLRALELLELVRIDDPLRCYDLYPYELSGGMCQRVMIALALAPDPKLLIADEPTTALDVTVQAQILELLKEIQTYLGMSIIFITHNFNLVYGFCDRLLVMYAGQIIEESTTKELFSAPKHPYTKALLRSIPHLALDKQSKLEVIEGQPPDLSSPIKGCPFANRCKFSVSQCQQASPQLINRVSCWLYDPRFKENYVKFTAS